MARLRTSTILDKFEDLFETMDAAERKACLERLHITDDILTRQAKRQAAKQSTGVVVGKGTTLCQEVKSLSEAQAALKSLL